MCCGREDMFLSLFWIWDIIFCLSFKSHPQWFRTVGEHDNFVVPLCLLDLQSACLGNLEFSVGVQHQVTSLPLQGRKIRRQLSFRPLCRSFCCCLRQCSLCIEHRVVGLENEFLSAVVFCWWWSFVLFCFDHGVVLNMSVFGIWWWVILINSSLASLDSDH